jgi:hypothetical protein
MNTLRRSGHGGNCCGINHISNFYNYQGKLHILERINQTNQNGKHGMLIEVVLTNAQCRNMRLMTDLKDIGFRLVSRFVNPNSRAMCNVFHYNKKFSPINNRLSPGLRLFVDTP